MNLAQLKSEGKVLLDVDYRRGEIKDYSGFNHTVTATGGTWCNGRAGRGINFNSGDVHTVATSANLEVTGCWLVVNSTDGFFRPGGINSRFISKRDAGGCNYDFYATATGLGYFDGTNVSSYTVSLIDVRQVAIYVVHNARPKIYINGSYHGEITSNRDVIVNDAPVSLGNFYAAGANNCTVPISQFLILRADATEQDLADVYSEFVGTTGAVQETRRNLVQSLPVRSTGATLKLYYDFTLDAQKRVIDKSGNDFHGVFGTNIQLIPSPISENGLSTRFNYVQPTNLTSTAKSYTFEFILSQATVTGLDYLFDSAAGRLIVANGSNVARLGFFDGTWRSFGNAQLPNNTILHLVYTLDSASGLGKCYVNNVQQDVAQTYVGVDIGGVSRFFSTNSVVGANYEGNVYMAKLYEGVLTEAEIAANYSDFAQLMILQNNMQDAVVTTADVTGGRIGNTEFSVVSGGWKVNSAKYIEPTGISVATTPVNFDYGTIVFEFSTANVNTLDISWGNLPVQWQTTTFNGYLIALNGSQRVALYRILNGIANPAFFIGDNNYYTANTLYRIAMTRTTAGVFTMYIKGGTFTNFTLINASTGTNPYTDTTFTVLPYFNVGSRTGGGHQFRLLGIHRGAMSTDQLNTLY